MKSIDEVLRSCSYEVQCLVRAEDRLFNPTRNMNGLERYIYEAERIYSELYVESDEQELEDPFERIARNEEQQLFDTGRNYAGRIINRK